MSGEVSCAYSEGRTKGTSAPHFSATDAISASSVLTTTRVTRPDSRAWRIDHAMRGLPPISITFFRGMLFEPPRAGISASTPAFTLLDQASVRRGQTPRADPAELVLHWNLAVVDDLDAVSEGGFHRADVLDQALEAERFDRGGLVGPPHRP